MSLPRSARRFMRIAAGLLLALPLLAGGVPASGDVIPVFSDTFTAAGTGTYTPGITLTGCAWMTITFNLSFYLVGDDATIAGEYFTGTGWECPTSGSGSGQLGGVMAGNASYSRTGNVMTLSAGGTINGESHTAITWICQVDPTNINPETSFTIACHGVLTS